MIEDLFEIERTLNLEWQTKRLKVDWVGMETTLVAILNLNIENVTAPQKVSLCKDCIDAYTKRGHFTGR